MPRCLLTASVALTLAVPVLAFAQSQAPRNFPANALRGELLITAPPHAQLNGRDARLAPGARIRGTNQMLLMSGAIAGQKLVVNYTLETHGLLQDVWVLRPDEIKKRWPETAKEAATWSFNYLAQTWTKP